MQETHIASAFDRDIETIQALIVKMGGMVEDNILNAAQSLVDRDEELAEDILRRDRAVDALEEQVNEEAVRIIALRQPIAVDLRHILTVMKISGNLERIGDYAKNMAKRTKVLSHMAQVNGSAASIKRMCREVHDMLHDVLDAYVQRDADLALQVLERDADVDQMYNALFREFLTFMMEDPRNITPCMHLHFIAKNTERMGDHVTNIAEEVIFFVTGEPYDEKRPKEDVTSVDPTVMP